MTKVVKPTPSSLIVRSNVPAGKSYPEYKPYLRSDFFFSCAYCTMMELEAQAIRFTIDHYEPKSARPDLEHQYDNLMWACDECNTRKGDRHPPQSAREEELRFFRPDQDLRQDHFKLTGQVLEPKSNVGYFSIEALDLNRQTLKRLRVLRKKLEECEKFVSEGITALRGLHIDRLPQHIKAHAAAAIKKAVELKKDMEQEIDSILRHHAQSELIPNEDNSDEEVHAQEITQHLREIEAAHPGTWRKKKKQKKHS